MKAGVTNEMLAAEYEAVYHYVLSLCRSENEAQDITQETLLRAMTAKRSFAGGSSLYTWLCSIAKNLWTDRCRAAKKKAEGGIAEDIPADGASPESLASDKDMSMRIHKVLHTLDEPYKEVFSLRVFGQLSFADIAELFGRTESWARVTYHRGRKRITEILEKENSL